MWPHLLLTIDEFERMVERGAFDHLDRKVELIRGELRQMNPPGPLHDALIVYLNNWSLRSALPADILVTARTGLDLSHLESRPEPDLMWINAGRYRDRHPSASDVRLAIEVAYSSLQVDMNEKAELYAEAGIVEYWIVDAVSSCVHVFREPDGSVFKYRDIANRGDMLSPLAYADAKLDVADLFGG